MPISKDIKFLSNKAIDVKKLSYMNENYSEGPLFVDTDNNFTLEDAVSLSTHRLVVISILSLKYLFEYLKVESSDIKGVLALLNRCKCGDKVEIKPCSFCNNNQVVSFTNS